MVVIAELVGVGSGPQSQKRLSPGMELPFAACARSCCGGELITPGIGGVIYVYERHYEMANRAATSMRVSNLENPGEGFPIPPRSGRSPIPFELAAFTGTAGHVLTVYGPEPARSGGKPFCSTGDGAAPSRPRRDTTKYHVLYALCEGRLRGDHASPLPTSTQIAYDLSVSRTTVRRAIDSLADDLDLSPDGQPTTGWKTHALVNAAFSRGLITGPPA